MFQRYAYSEKARDAKAANRRNGWLCLQCHHVNERDGATCSECHRERLTKLATK
jgi:hypothetical protein